MLTTDELRSPVFNRLTGRLAPRLIHPTAKAFDFDIWCETVVDDDLGERDLDLLMAAQYIGGNLAAIRESLVAPLFDGLSGDQIVELAVANANRAWNIFRWHLRKAMPKPEDGFFYTATLGQEGIPIGPEGALVHPHDANNALIDALPYWFAEAAGAAGERKELDRDGTLRIMLGGNQATNLLQMFKSVWQEVLWEPWSFRFDDRIAQLAPGRPDDLARWRAWDWREQMLSGQRSLLNRNLEKDLKDIAFALPLTAVAISGDAIETGAPSDVAAAQHRSAFETLQKTYAAAFLDEQIGEGGLLTVTILESAFCILQDLAYLCLPADADPAELDDGDPLRFSHVFPRAQLAALLVETLGIASEVADAALTSLSVDPFGELGTLFNIGLWHRPLIRSRDGSLLYITTGALLWSSPVRRVERWLQKGEDWTDTPAGIRYESALREALAEAIAGNQLLAEVPTGISSIPQGAAAEEVDLLLRIGNTIIVGEIKCLLGPSEPIERHNYVSKLEGACAQAARKANWLQANPDELGSRFGAGAAECRLIPLVIVNQSNGVEWHYDGAAITDARFLELFVGSGSLIFSGKLHSKPGEAPELFERTMYVSAVEAEALIPGIFRNIPGMDPFRHSIGWTENVLPIAGGRELRLAVPFVDTDAYGEVMDKLLGDAGAGP